jgi:hypothetical protein
MKSITVVLSFGLLVRSVRLRTMKQFDNNNKNNCKKLRDLILKSRLNYISFNKRRKRALRERDSRR